MKNRKSKSGFTLVELLVVVTIIAIISGMVVMLVGGATDKAAATVSMSTQKQLTNQINSFMQLHSGLLPDKFDALIRADYATAGGSFTTLATGISVAVDPSLFLGCSPSAGASGALNINRGVNPTAFSGQNRTMTVKQATANDVTYLNQVGVTTFCYYGTGDLSYGRPTMWIAPLSTTGTAVVGTGGMGSPPTYTVGTAICIVDPQSVAGQLLYSDFGVDLSNTATYPRNGASTGTYSWDDSNELTAAGRLAALQKQIFYVMAVGVNSTMIGDQKIGIQEAPTSSVVTGGYYNRYALVLTYGGAGSRSTDFVGVLDPLGRGPSAARQAVNAQ